MSLKAWHVPVRVAAGAFILNSGIGKRSVDEARATMLRTEAARAFPIFEEIDPSRFADLLSKGEIVLGAALLVPFVPSWLAGGSRRVLGEPAPHLPPESRASLARERSSDCQGHRDLEGCLDARDRTRAPGRRRDQRPLTGRRRAIRGTKWAA